MWAQNKSWTLQAKTNLHLQEKDDPQTITNSNIVILRLQILFLSQAIALNIETIIKAYDSEWQKIKKLK